MNENLRQIFKIIEMAAFPVWQKSDKKQRESIVKKIAKIEVVAIIKNIKVECNNPKIQKHG